MAIKSFNPYSPSRRFITVSTFEEITTDKPYRPLVEKLQKHAGRNNTGKMTVRHKGGGVKRLYRVIDFKRTKDGIPARVATIEYDPNRNARIALVNYVDGEKRYIIAPLDLKVGDMIESGPEADIKIGNCLPHDILRSQKDLYNKRQVLLKSDKEYQWQSIIGHVQCDSIQSQ